ncbi:putative nuclease HARBI1 isoform X2 [Uloborus diversus]|uniref:putative nuclease HARBI1 isoform X2 n=1 Tax=Uloborus diversus TaxID=327109 RepID=UPI0024091730|nr:putative nuclease HARBI1 isoform X2 [Uloborus diversus]
MAAVLGNVILTELMMYEMQRRSIYRQRYFNIGQWLQFNEFDLPDAKFIESFCIPKKVARVLCDELKPELKCTSVYNNFVITSEKKNYVTDGKTFHFSQSSISRCINKVCAAINKRMLKKWVKFPTDSKELERNKREFEALIEFPGVVGAVDCSHIEIITPPSKSVIYPRQIFCNESGTYSLNVQLVCDAQLRILNCNAKFPGSVKNSEVWNKSAVRRVMEKLHSSDQKSWLLGDNSYPLEPWLMTPIQDPETDLEETYNIRHLCGLSVIQKCIHVLKSRFKCLLGERPLYYSPRKAANIVNACAVLHNMCVHFNVSEPNLKELNSPETNCVVSNEVYGNAGEIQQEIVNNLSV